MRLRGRVTKLEARRGVAVGQRVERFTDDTGTVWVRTTRTRPNGAEVSVDFPAPMDAGTWAARAAAYYAPNGPHAVGNAAAFSAAHNPRKARDER